MRLSAAVVNLSSVSLLSAKQSALGVNILTFPSILREILHVNLQMVLEPVVRIVFHFKCLALSHLVIEGDV